MSAAKLPRDDKSEDAMMSFIQLGDAPPAALSQPMCATCFTSVGQPISISCSFTAKIREKALRPLKIPFTLHAIGDRSRAAHDVVPLRTQGDGKQASTVSDRGQAAISGFRGFSCG